MKLVPPKHPLQFLRWFCHEDYLDEIEGDLTEVFIKQAEINPGKAKLKFTWSVLKYFRPMFMKSFRNSHQPNSFGMYQSYFKIGWRSILKNKGYSFINITGLSIGLACCMLLLLYTKDEVSYDNFHEKKERLFQLTVKRLDQNGNGKRFGMAAMIQGPSFKQEIPEIEEFVRVRNQELTIKQGEKIFAETVSWVDANFFTVFNFPLLVGNSKNALTAMGSVVLSKETANRYFGSAEAVGKSLDVEIDGTFKTFVVSAVAEDCPQNSSIKFKIALPFNYLEEVHPDNGWHWVSFPTYFLLHPKAEANAVTPKMEKVYQAQAKQEIDEMRLMGYGDKFTWGLQPFSSMHLNTEFEGTPEASDPIYSYILTGIALFILIIACINFINLTVAQSIKRGKEIGVRKVIGGQRAQLIGQFLGESFALCLVAFVLAALLAQSVLPFFNDLANKKLSLGYLLDGKLIVGSIVLFLITGFVAGFYPALVLSGFSPLKTLYNRVTIARENYLGKALVVIQFSLAAFLITSTLFIYQQFTFLTNMNLGYDDKNLLEISVEKAIMDKSLSHLLKTEFSSVKGVEVVAPRNVGKFGGSTKTNGREVIAVYEHVDENYLTALNISLAMGRNFSTDFPSDSIQSVLVNETFVKEAGWANPIGETIDFMNIPGWGNRKVTIVGVVKDHHFESLKEKIKPEVFTFEPKLPLGKFLVRMNGVNVPEIIKSLEIAYHKIFPYDLFQYSFKDEMNKNNYKSEAKWKDIITASCCLTVFISCIGLFGLSTLSTQRRTKEISMRKILGASPASIVRLVSQDFIKLVLIGFVISIPVVWIAIHSWLERFAYRISMSIWFFAMAGILALLIAFLAVSVQAFHASNNNPVDSLKSNN